jgi:hypothetical protein
MARARVMMGQSGNLVGGEVKEDPWEHWRADAGQ